MTENRDSLSDRSTRTVAFRCARCHRLSFSPSGNCEHGVPAPLVLEVEFERLQTENERLRANVVKAMLDRIREAADIVDPNAVSRTSGTLLKMAVVLALEFAGATDENCNDGETTP